LECNEFIPEGNYYTLEIVLKISNSSLRKPFPQGNIRIVVSDRMRSPLKESPRKILKYFIEYSSKEIFSRSIRSQHI
jgi:hypothetical protein